MNIHKLFQHTTHLLKNQNRHLLLIIGSASIFSSFFTVYHFWPSIKQLIYKWSESSSSSKKDLPSEELNLNSLPDEILLMIFSHLEESDLLSLCPVCHRWRRLMKDEELWKSLFYERFVFLKNKKRRRIGYSTLYPTASSELLNFSNLHLSSQSPFSIPVPPPLPSNSKLSEKIEDLFPPFKRNIDSDFTWITNFSDDHVKKSIPTPYSIPNSSTTSTLSSPTSSSSSFFKSTNLSEKIEVWCERYKEVFSTEYNWCTGYYDQKVLQGHDAPVYCLYFEEKRPFLASGSGDATVKLWNWETSKLYYTLKHNDSVRAIQFDTQFLYTGSGDGSVKMSDFETSRLLQTFHTPTCPPVFSLQCEGRMMITGHGTESSRGGGGGGGNIMVWDLRSRRTVKKFAGHKGSVYCLQFDPYHSPPLLATAASDALIKLWDIRMNQRPIEVLRGHTSWIHCLEFNSQYLISGSFDQTVRIWDLSLFSHHSYSSQPPPSTTKTTTTTSSSSSSSSPSSSSSSSSSSKSLNQRTKSWVLRSPIVQNIQNACESQDGQSYCIHEIESCHGAVRSLQFDPVKLVVAYWDGTFHIYDMIPPNMRDSRRKLPVFMKPKKKIFTNFIENDVDVDVDVDIDVQNNEYDYNEYENEYEEEVEEEQLNVINEGESGDVKYENRGNAESEEKEKEEEERQAFRLMCTLKYNNIVYCAQYDDEKMISGSHDSTATIWSFSDNLIFN